MKSVMITRLPWISLVALLLMVAPIGPAPNCCNLVHAASPQPKSPAQPAATEGKPTSPGQSSPRMAIPQPKDWFAGKGGKFQASTDPNRPAILLVHGLHSSARAWTEPADDPAVGGYYYDHQHDPRRVKDRKSYPGVGIYKEGKSERSSKEVNDNNWFDYLVGKNFTVATWNQPGEKFAEAYESAEDAFGALLNSTTGPIALIGHSRGGLVIRKLLKEKVLKQNIGAGRVRWVITLHSPHTGSELAKGPEILLAEVGLRCKQIPAVPDKWLPNVRKMCNELLDSLAKRLAKPGSLELAPGGPVLGPLAEEEAPVPGVSYYTFGGTSPTYIRYYLWQFTAGSAVPQYKCDPAPPKCKQYFKWEAVPKEISAISPMYDVARDVVPEIKRGAGDGLVADARARLPFATHATSKLNHAEVLWSRPVQQRVVQLLSSNPPLKKGRP